MTLEPVSAAAPPRKIEYVCPMHPKIVNRELSSMGIQEFVNKKLVRVAPIDAPA